jgi:hypothetical protein
MWTAKRRHAFFTIVLAQILRRRFPSLNPDLSVDGAPPLSRALDQIAPAFASHFPRDTALRLRLHLAMPPDACPRHPAASGTPTSMWTYGAVWIRGPCPPSSSISEIGKGPKERDRVPDGSPGRGGALALPHGAGRPHGEGS